MTNSALALMLKQLRLTTVLKNYSDFAKEASTSNQTYESYLKALIQEEVNYRSNNLISRLIFNAKFDQLKTIEEFRFEDVPNLHKPKVIQLTDCHFIDKKENICFLGQAGAGKSHLAKAIAYEACKKKYAVRFIQAAILVNEFLEAKQNYSLSKIIDKYKKYQLIVLDELGYIPFSKEGSELLFQFFSDRYEHASIIVTTNLEFGDWTRFLGDPTMTAALLDRFTHHCHIFTLNTESFRFKQRKKDA